MSAKPSKRVLGGREQVKVAIAQTSPAFMNRDASVARACAAIEETGRNGAHLVVFPEAWLAGVYVALGCNEMDPRAEVQTIYNSLLFFSPDSTVLGGHRKLMPTLAECLFWGQGDACDLAVFDTDIGRLGGLICGEHLMTLARACLIAQGEDIHVAVFPGAFELHTGPQLEEPEHGGGFWGHFEVRAHALEAGGSWSLAVLY